MRRSPWLLIVALVTVGPRAFAQQPMAPYGDEPPPAAAPPSAAPTMPVPPPPSVPPPIVAPPPSPYYAPQPYYYNPYAQPRSFHEELRPNYGLVVAGVIVLGASWSINAMSAYLAGEWKLAVPLIGPFMETQNVNTGPGYEANRMLVALLAFDGMIECAGAILLVAGAVTHHKVRVYDSPRVSIVPTAGPAGAGLAAFGRF